ncbi:transcriptional regulator [Mycolicibacterium duvalii]|uniref:Transcriptional regulator n=1 Tax=Mycolicibacterium duvalii TaxID=39688 RepID=A0A7I7JZJ8_9MYCO|nr:helix-turn-helix transcriptional regulator [Mycolicibacterium duvalii]MCV7366780.1 helix-turn-helix domain-containing protein [Mycolicibacterium duvalii]PEG43912.1 transcriptional regulator [Mycolicibacterium duvalii]BBX16758.1 transcriptional regulator [Mycolicibacterium duvalii]
MTAQSDRRAELGAFLRARRQRIARDVHGLPDLPRGRRTGLRREEVSALCGVSITWYTWLEQGRPITPSRQVLDAIAQTLRLSATEHQYLLGLAGYAPPMDPTRTEPAPDHIQRLIDALGERPAYVLAGDWSIVGWNSAYAELYPNVAKVDVAERNLLWLVFTDPSVRTLLDDWEVTSARFLGEFRAQVAGRLSEAPIRELLERLRAVSAEFRRGWDTHPVAGFESRERVFHHPTAGRLRYEHHQLRPSDRPDLQIVVYTPYHCAQAAPLRPA